MSEELVTAVKLIVGLLTIISIMYGFYKIITDKAKLESDLRNEIKNLRENDIRNLRDDQADMCELIDKMTKKFDLMSDVVSIRLGEITVVQSRVKDHDMAMERLTNKMDEFSNKLTDIKILLERKSDR